MGHEGMPAEVAGAEAAWALKRCARCGSEFRCGADTPSCWCDSVRLADDQRARLAGLRLEGCLCPACLEGL